MKFERRQFLHLAAGAVSLPAVTRIAGAQTYPTRPITVIVAFAAGGPVDTMARILAERMRRSLGQAVIIENVSGADGSIGTARVARAKADGYTIEMGLSGTHALNAGFYSLQYDVLSDFSPISPIATGPYVLFAKKSMPAADITELIASLKTKPGSVTAGIATSTSHLLTAFFEKLTGTRLTLVPYRGGAPAMQDLVAGQIDLYFYPTDGLSFMRAESVKAYGVTSSTRLAQAPQLPTFAEMGLPALSYLSWWGLFAPKGTPTKVVGRLNAAAVDALADPTVRSRLSEFGYEVVPREQQRPEALTALQKVDAEKWWPIIKELGIKAQ